MTETCFVYHQGTVLRGLAQQRCDTLFEDCDCTEVPYDEMAKAVIEGFAMLGYFTLRNGFLVPNDPAMFGIKAASLSPTDRVLAFDGYLARLEPSPSEPLIALVVSDGGRTITATLSGDIRTDRKIFLTVKDDPGVLLGTLTIKQQPAEQVLTVAADQDYDVFVINAQYDDFGLAR